MDFEKKLDKKFEHIDQELERKTGEAEERTQRKYDAIERRMSENSPEASTSEETAPQRKKVSSAPSETFPTGEGLAKGNTNQGAGVTHEATLPPGAKPLVHQQEFRSLYVPSEAEIQQAWAFVSRSPHVTENHLYRLRVQAANFLLDMEETAVNAYATDYPVKRPDGTVLEGPTVVFCGGLANALCLSATALALQRCIREVERQQGAGKARDSQSPIKTLFEAMGHMIVRDNGELSRESASLLYEKVVVPTLREVADMGQEDYAHYAPSFRFSLYMFAIAHEMGHIAYGHTLGECSNYSVSRAQEFDADSFASQVLSSCAYSEYHFLAQVLVTIVFAWMQHAGGIEQGSTHPLGVERFRQMFRDADNRAEQEVADTFGMVRTDLEGLLPSA